MGARLRSWWQYIRKHWVITIIIIALIAVGMTIFLGYRFKWDWTGLNEHIGPNVQQYQPAKTLWDWLNLLGVFAIPVVVALGAAWYTAQQGKVSDRENTDNQRETALQKYIDNMSELLLHEKSRGSAEENEVRNIARVRTLTVLPRLDVNRKTSVLQFLYESHLIDKDKRIIDLRGADLCGADLNGVDLSGAHLSGANLNAADLSGTDLSGAILGEALLSYADLSYAKFSGATLSGAALNEAILSEANISGTDLRFADLSGAKVTEEQLKQARSLEGAIMPDGTVHP